MLQGVLFGETAIPARANTSPSSLIAAIQGAEPGARAGRVLVAEDNVVNQKVVLRLLEKLGWEADLAENGREAVDALKHGEYAAILMDCQMPEMDGYEAAAQIRAMPAPASSTPVIALTANATSEDRERCLASGMDDYLAKPIRPDALHETLERWSQGGRGSAAEQNGEPAPDAVES